MAMSNKRFAVCVAFTFLATLVLFNGGKRQSQADTSSGKNQSEVGTVYPDDVKPECRAAYDLAYRIDWDYEPFDYGIAMMDAKQRYKNCDQAKERAELDVKLAAQSIARKRSNDEVRRRAGSQ